MSFLYRTEAKGIQSWILATDRLQELAGASQIVDELGEFAKRRAVACGGVPVQIAAGAATLQFEKLEGLESFAAWWPMAAEARAPGLTVVQAWVEGEDWASLQQHLAEERNRAVPDLPEAGPLLARTGRTGLPAVARSVNGIQDRATRAKQAVVSAERRSKCDRLTEHLLPKKIDGREASFLEDHGGFPEGYLAVIHADANGIGKLFAAGKVKNVSEFSKAMAEATEAAARAAVMELFQGALERNSERGDPEIVVRARPIVLGGDDFTIIVPGRDALQFARTYLSEFEKQTAQRTGQLGQTLHACAGVAIVKPGWPFHEAHRLAEGLCKAAKKKVREKNPDQKGHSALAFHRVTTALSASFEELLVDELSTQDGWAGAVPRERTVPEPEQGLNDTRAVLTMNPYALEELEHLERLADAAAALPRGTLRQWGTLARRDTARAQEHWQRFREVAKETNDGRAKLTRLDEALLNLRGTDPETGWARESGTTPLVDALEWYYAKARVLSPRPANLDPSRNEKRSNR